MFPPTLIDQKLIDAIAQRKPCDFSTGTDADSINNSSQWGPERTIDSAVLRKVLLDDEAGYGLANQPLEITGARIAGVADFRAASVPRPVHFVKCVFPDVIDCTDARLQTMSFEGCRVGNLRARYAQLEGSLLLRYCALSGPLELESASVTRDIDMRGSRLSAEAPINANRLDVGGSIYFRDGFCSEAKISLEGAQIASAFDAIRGTFRNDKGGALFLNTAKINGFCSLSFATFEANDGPALSAEGAQIEGFLSLARSKVNGLLMMRGIRVGANLNLSGITLENLGNVALDLERAKIAGDFLLNPHESGTERTVSNVVGSISFLNASIEGAVSMYRASIRGGKGMSLSQAVIAAEGLQVGGFLNLARSSIEGFVMLRDVQVRRTVNLSGTKVSNPGKTALDMERAKIGGDVFIRRYEQTDAPSEMAAIIGGVFMTGARIDGSLFVQDSSIQNGGEELRFNRMNVSGAFRFADIICGSGRVSFANSKVFTFADDGTIWPKRGFLLLNGFDYGSLTGKAQTGWRVRLDWLRRFGPDEYNPQPFTTLVTVLRRTGHDRDAKRIAIARYREARKYMRVGSPRWLGNLLMDATSGHGYRPWLAVMWIGLFIGVGYVVFNLDLADRVPLKEQAAALYRNGKMLPSDYPTFQPLLYSADVLLPIVNLQQKDYWAPNSAGPRGYWARFYLPFHILAGWFFTTLFVVGVTGLIRRE